MSEPAGSTGAVRYHRRARSPFRVVNGRCLIGAPGHKTVAVGGSAVMIWLLLDSPRSAAELHTRIREDWPELGEVTVELVQDAIDAFVAEGLAEAERAGETQKLL